MRHRIAFYGIALFAGSVLILTGCGKTPVAKASRVSVKHALDPDAAAIQRTPKPITVEELAAMGMPAGAKGNLEDYSKKRVTPFETQVFTVDATIKSVQHKKDGDYYLVLSGKSGAETAVEVPDPELCKGSPLEAEIREARKQIEERYHPTDTLKPVNEPAQVEGVGFMGWRGRPTKGARLMPGLRFQFKK